MSGISFRSAEAEDYEAVLAINTNIYDGDDYLPEKYHDFIQDPSYHLYIASMEGKVVSFGIHHVVDDGETVIAGGGRTAPVYQGQRIINYLQSYAATQTKKRVPQLKRIVVTSGNKLEMEKLVKKVPSAKYVVMRPYKQLSLITSEMLTHMVHSSAFRTLKPQYSGAETRLLSRAEAFTTLCNIDVEEFLPEGTWVVDWNPFRHFRSNYKLISNNAKVIVTINPGDNKVKALSFGSINFVKKGIRYIFDFYCKDCDNNGYVLVAHFAEHLKHIHQVYAHSAVSFFIVWSRHVSFHELGEILEQLGIETVEDNVANIVERPVDSYESTSYKSKL